VRHSPAWIAEALQAYFSKNLKNTACLLLLMGTVVVTVAPVPAKDVLVVQTTGGVRLVVVNR